MLEATFVLLFVINPLTILLAVLITKGVVMSEVQDAVDAVVVQLSKAKAEIVSEIESLEAAVVSGEPVDLTALKAAAQALDDVVVDVVEEVPVEEV
jgi:malonyl CoA-acyl carrier protein transacylase